MARNYTMKEAVEIITTGSDYEAIADIGRRYPILMHMVSKVSAKAGNDFAELMSHLPDHVTANKVNTSMKSLIDGVETEDEDGDDAPEKPSKNESKKAASDDYESMSGKELWEVLGKAGKRKDCKEKMGGVKKADILEYIKKYGLEDEVVEDEVDADAENPYDGISAMELFKECKKRGIKAAPKKTAKYYADLLTKADEEVGNNDEADEDWGEEVEEPKEEKPAKKTNKKAKKEEVEEVEEEEEDADDDWDI